MAKKKAAARPNTKLTTLKYASGDLFGVIETTLAGAYHTLTYYTPYSNSPVTFSASNHDTPAEVKNTAANVNVLIAQLQEFVKSLADISTDVDINS